jgi:hypothetical protein
MPTAARLRPSFRPSFAYLSTALLAALLAACGDGAMPPTPGVDATVPPADLGGDAAVPDLGAPDMRETCADADGDGVRDAACGGTDCDDTNPSRYPGAPEVCDAADLDEDCDPETFGFRDADGDGFPDARCCNGTTCGDDCNDARPGVNPMVPEVCNAIDDDCDGSIDEDLLVMIYTDADRDGFGAGAAVAGCAGTTGTVTNGNDCDDTRASSNPAAMEACDGTYDDDCDGSLDEGCGCVTGMMRGCGGAGAGACVSGTQTCIAGLWAGCSGSGPSTETCNGLDDDCDGMTDEELLVEGCFVDGDSDGFGAGDATTRCRDTMRGRFGFCPAGYTNHTLAFDCNDAIAEVRPGGIERCDTLDNDCNGAVDDVIGLGDACTDGVGSCARNGMQVCGGGMLVCSAVAGTPTAEACNGLDDNCNGLVDDGLITVFDCRVDADSDGFGVGEPTTQCSSSDPSREAFGRCPVGYTNTVQLDCNDTSSAVRPLATENCNGVDDDCDGGVDDGVLRSFYRDEDVDGVGTGAPVLGCFPPPGFAESNGDCNDGNRDVRPGASELCDGVIDHDCNGTIDDDCACTNGATQVCGSSVGLCTMGSQTCSGGTWGACSGTAPRGEICDGLDQDCDGIADDGVTTNYYPDSDGDGFGAGVAVAACAAPAGLVANSSDCNDANGTIGPGAPESCNGVDDDCDGVVDESCTCVPGSTRACGLTVGVCTTGLQTCTGAGWTECSGVSPGVETCNGRDDDCDGFDDDVIPALSGLTISCGGLAPAFTPSTTLYRVSPPAGTTSCEIAPAIACAAGLTITVNGVPVSSGASLSVALTGVVTTLTVRVTSSDGATRDYDVVVRKQSMYVKASNTEAFDQFGQQVAMSADGSTLAVSAAGESSEASGIGGEQGSNGLPSSGAVYVFRRMAGAWAQEAYVKASNPGFGDFFGSSLALSADGATLVVGALAEDSAASGVGGDESSNERSGSGAVYVFRRTSGVWSQEAYVKASNPDASDQFGYAVALSADGAVLAVAAHLESSSATGVNGNQASNAALNSGAVYVLRRSGEGDWAQEAYLKASNTGAGDQFGFGLAMSADGDSLVVGATEEDSSATGVGGSQSNNFAMNAGAAYVFRRTSGVWGQDAYLKASNSQAGDLFGFAVAMSGDGAVVAVGARLESSAATGVDGNQASNAAGESGAVYVFRRTLGTWAQEAYVKATNTNADDGFGVSVALSADGSTLAVGAPYEDSDAVGIGGDETRNDAPNAGAAYLFRRSASGWAPSAYLKASNTGPGDSFGISVSVSADGATLVAGAGGEASAATGLDGDAANDDAMNAGAVYVF